MSDTPTMAGLHPGARLLYFVLRDLAEGSDTVTVGRDALSTRCGWGASNTVRKRLRDLESHGYITKTERYTEWGARLPNTYTLRKG